MRIVQGLLLAIAVLATLVAAPSLASAGDHCQPGQIDCIQGGGNQDDGSIVTGGVIWPHGGGFTIPGGGGDSSCEGCEWKLVIACMFKRPGQSRRRPLRRRDHVVRGPRRGRPALPGVLP